MYSDTFSTFKEALVIAYYYIINADGIIDPKEVSFGQRMIKQENIRESDYNTKLEELKSLSHEDLKHALKEIMKKLNSVEQVRIIAYMSKVADADGYRDPSEMSSIQDIYSDLHIHLNDVIRVKESIVLN